MASRSFSLVTGIETDDLGSNSFLPSTTLVSKNSDYVILDDDSFGTIKVVDTSSARTITLPTAADNTSREITIVKSASGANIVTVEGEGAETINGELNVILYEENDRVKVQSDGTNWIIVGEKPKQRIQDFTARGTVGAVAQQEAGHIWETDEGGTGTDIAYYKMLTGAITTDEEGTYTLTNNNAVTEADGIFGNKSAVEFNGTNQTLTHASLLDTTPAALAFLFWIKADDGQPANAGFFFEKSNIANQDFVGCYLQTDGKIYFRTEQANAGVITLPSSTIFPNGAMADWHFVCCTWNTTTGMSLYINGYLVARDDTATTLMGNGTGADFIIGCDTIATNYYDGKMSLFQVRDQVMTDEDVLKAYATRYAHPAAFPDNNYDLYARVRKGGSATKEREYKLIEVARDSDYLYRAGGVINGLDSTDEIKIEAGR